MSITTVSHVFSSKRHVSEETRKRVLEVSERLGYRPRASARALATGRSMTIALQHSLSSPEFALNPFFGAMLTSMSEAAINAGYSFIFVPADPPAEVFVTPLIAERRVDGAILIDPVPGDAFVDAVIALEMPAVSLGRIDGHPEKLTVDHDHARATEAVLEHLTERRLIAEVARQETPGHPRLFGTTLRFLQLVGLERIEDLPPVAESVVLPNFE